MIGVYNTSFKILIRFISMYNIEKCTPIIYEVTQMASTVNKSCSENILKIAEICKLSISNSGEAKSKTSFLKECDNVKNELQQAVIEKLDGGIKKILDLKYAEFKLCLHETVMQFEHENANKLDTLSKCAIESRDLQELHGCLSNFKDAADIFDW